MPSYLIYKTLNGRPLYRRGYRDGLTNKKKPAESVGSSSLQAAPVATLVTFLGRDINPKQYGVVRNESGVHPDRVNNRSNDIAIVNKALDLLLTKK